MKILKKKVVVSLVTMIVVMLGVYFGVGSLTGNFEAGFAFGAVASWFAYQVTLTLIAIEESLEQKSE